ncbi:hypothetical protein LWI29_024350 [Acer saccharum]|uniref:Uncharacterized protein n=1 Tax=Acer saccharum TaxID=4024 RepID=A0AA39RKE9_ACESA|nr:hypothetical protein LWI29_024350 [Acer saccharum]
MTQDRTEALLAEPDPNFFPNHDETITSRIIETVHMVKEIPPFRDKREVDEESNKEKKTFIDEIHNEKKENTFEVDDMEWGNSDNGNLRDVLGKISNYGRRLDSWNPMKRKQHRHEISRSRKNLKQASMMDSPNNWTTISKLEDKLDDALSVEESY